MWGPFSPRPRNTSAPSQKAYLETIEMNSSFFARFLVTENDHKLVTQSDQPDNLVATYSATLRESDLIIFLPFLAETSFPFFHRFPFPFSRENLFLRFNG